MNRIIRDVKPTNSVVRRVAHAFAIGALLIAGPMGCGKSLPKEEISQRCGKEPKKFKITFSGSEVNVLGNTVRDAGYCRCAGGRYLVVNGRTTTIRLGSEYQFPSQDGSGELKLVVTKEDLNSLTICVSKVASSEIRSDGGSDS